MEHGGWPRRTVYSFEPFGHYDSWLWKVAPVRQACHPDDLLRAAWLTDGDKNTLLHAGYHVRLRATVTEFLLLPPPVYTPQNKLSPPNDLHKSIKSLLVEFERPRPCSLSRSRRVSPRGKMFDRCSTRGSLISRVSCLLVELQEGTLLLCLFFVSLFGVETSRTNNFKVLKVRSVNMI